MLDVVIYHRQPTSPSRHVQLFARGLRSQGIDYEIRSSVLPRRSDLAVFWAHKQTKVMDTQRAAGKDYLVMERGYFGDRYAMTSLGFNGLNGHAQFDNKDSPADRWQRHGVPVKPWKTDGEVIVLMGQVPTDASLRNCPNYKAWVERTARAATEAYGLRVFFRPHPAPQAASFRPDLPIIGGTLESALDRAAAVIVWNSNSGVDAVLHGVPVIACDKGTMAHAMATTMGAPLIRPDRTQWLNDLAYTQWTESEIESGTAWKHLHQRYA